MRRPEFPTFLCFLERLPGFFLGGYKRIWLKKTAAMGEGTLRGLFVKSKTGDHPNKAATRGIKDRRKVSRQGGVGDIIQGDRTKGGKSAFNESSARPAGCR